MESGAPAKAKAQQEINLPPIEKRPARQSAKVGFKDQPSSSKNKPGKDFSLSHPSLIGVCAEDLHPVHSELVSDIYKRPLVVSLLIPKKKSKKFERSSKSTKGATPVVLSAGEESGIDSDRELPRGRSKKSKKPGARVLVLKVYDLVQSREAVYTIVVRDFEAQLAELVNIHGKEAADHFCPSSLDWWRRYLRDVTIAFDKPTGEITCQVDKSVISSLVEYKVRNRDNQDLPGTTGTTATGSVEAVGREAEPWTRAGQAAKEAGEKEGAKKLRRKAPSRSSLFLNDFSNPVDWNDNVNTDRISSTVAFDEPRLTPERSPTRSTVSLSLSLNSLSAPLQPGESVEVNFLGRGEWFGAVVGRAHRSGLHYDILHGDGSLQSRVDALLLRRPVGLEWGAVEGEEEEAEVAAEGEGEGEVAAEAEGEVAEAEAGDSLEDLVFDEAEAGCYSLGPSVRQHGQDGEG
ncbi:hypothetical protein B484DRAFT_204170, partial [Ochromonadaceae sp. CCMP2298]